MTTSNRPARNEQTSGIHYADKPEGPITAAILAGGIGALTLGAVTTLAEASEPFKEWLTWSEAVGPLSGKVILAVLAWLVAWIMLQVLTGLRPQETRRALILALVLIALGVLGTFPPFFQIFAPG